MIKHVTKVAIVVAALAAMPGAAQAGTASATGTAAFNVTSQCTVTGANVNLGTFNVNDTWAIFGSQVGYWANGNVWKPGSSGFEYLNYGSVTCGSGTPYTLTIRGTGTAPTTYAIRLVIGGKTAYLAPFIKKVGATTLADNGTAPNAGRMGWANAGVPGTGTGTAQSLLGSALLDLANSPGTLDNDKFAVAGTYSDTLTYTLNF